MKLIPFEISKYYHFHNRGNNKENLFVEKENYQYFLKLMVKYLTSIVDFYAYCLLPNHFHLVIKIKDENELPEAYKTGKIKLHQPFSNFFNAYTKAINKRYNRTGSLFQKHPSKHLIDTERYLRNVVVYVNTNSEHHGIADFSTYDFSSYKDSISQNKTILKQEEIIELFEDVKNFKYVHNLKILNKNLLDELMDDD